MARLEIAERTSGVTDLLYDVAGSNALIAGARFVAVGYGSSTPPIRVSTNGYDWAASGGIPSDVAQYLMSVTQDGTYWYVGGKDSSGFAAVWRSLDLTTWTKVFAPGSGTYVRHIWFDGTNYMCCGDAGTVGRSIDGGATWSSITPPGGVTETCWGIAGNGSGRWVISKADGLWYTDNVGTSWTVASTVPANTGGFYKTVWNGSYFMTRASDNSNTRMSVHRQAVRFYTSVDGNSWDNEPGFDVWATRKAALPQGFGWSSSRSVWIVAGADMSVFQSTGARASLSFEEAPYAAGIPVVRVTTGSEFDYLRGVCEANGVVVVVGENGKIAAGGWVTTDAWATNPSPAHQELGQLKPTTVPVTATLSWSNPGGTSSVYFGKDPENLVFQTIVWPANSWDPPGDLDPNETYYWRIDIDDSGDVAQGDLWRFFTEPTDTTEKLHTYGDSYHTHASGIDITAWGWTDIFTFTASQLAGGHRHLISMSAMLHQQVNSGRVHFHVYSEDSNGRQHYYDYATRHYVAPLATKSAQERMQVVVVPEPGQSLKVQVQGDGTAGSLLLYGAWITIIDLDSPGMVQGTDWDWKFFDYPTITNNSAANDAFPVIDLEWTPDGESDYAVFAGTRWDRGYAYLDPHGYRLRDRDTGQLLALTGTMHLGDYPTYGAKEDGQASIHALKKPPSELKRIRMDVWGYDYAVNPTYPYSWQLRDAFALWFRVSKMRNYAAYSSFNRHVVRDTNYEYIPDYDHGTFPDSAPFRPDADGTAVFMCYMQSKKDTRTAQTTSLGGLLVWGDFGLHQTVWDTCNSLPARGKQWGNGEAHDNDKNWDTNSRQRDSLLGVSRKTGLDNETRLINLWAANTGVNTSIYVTRVNIIAFGEQYSDAGGTPGIQQVQPRPGKQIVPHNEPITFKLASENGVDVDLVQIKRRWSPQSMVRINSDGAYIYSIASNGAGVLVGSSDKGTVYRSTDSGVTWAKYTLPLCSAAAYKACRKVLWNPIISKFVGVNDDGIAYASSDGITWAEVDTGGRNQYSIAQNSSGRMVIGDFDGHVFWSDDAITWNQVSSVGTRINDVGCDGSIFVACGTTNDLFTSPDGVTWTTRTTPGHNYHYCVAYGNGIWVITDLYYNQVLTSTDTINWTARELGHRCWPYRVSFGNGEFLMQSQSLNGGIDRNLFRDGSLWASTDGINWSQVGYISPDESNNALWGGQAKSVFWNASYVEGYWWISNGRPSGAMIKTADKLLGTTWEDVVIDNVFQSGWDGVGSSIVATPGIPGMVDVTIDTGSNLRFWTNYLIRVEASDSVTSNSMEPYEWDFNTWAEKLVALKVSYEFGYSVAAGSIVSEEIPDWSSAGHAPILHLPTLMATEGHRYLVLVTAQASASDGYEPIGYIARDSVNDAKSYSRYETVGGGVGCNTGFMGVYDDVKEGESFEWYNQTSAYNPGNASIQNSHVLAVDLDSPGMIENTCWWYNEVLDSAVDVPDGWYHAYAGVTFAEVTFDAAEGEDYLVIACCGMGNSNNYPNSAFRIFDETAGYEIARAGYRPSGNSTNLKHLHITAAKVTPASAGSYKVRVDMNGGGYFDHQYSSVFVLRLSTFKQHAVADSILNQSGLPPYVYPHVSGTPTPKGSVVLPGDDFGQILAVCICQGDSSSNTTGISPNTMLNGSRFADTQIGNLGSGMVNYSSAAGGDSAGSNGRPNANVINSAYGATGNNSLDMYVGAVSTSDVLERVAILSFGTELAPPPVTGSAGALLTVSPAETTVVKSSSGTSSSAFTASASPSVIKNATATSDTQASVSVMAGIVERLSSETFDIEGPFPGWTDTGPLRTSFSGIGALFDTVPENYEDFEEDW